MHQKGFAHILLLLVLITGLGVGLFLAKNPTFFKPKASESISGPIVPSPLPTPTSRFIKITYPNGGENFKVGETIKITWEYANLAQCILTYVTNGVQSTSFYPVNPAQNYYNWVVPSGSVGQTKIDASCYDSSSNGAQDQSDNFFTVSTPVLSPSPTPLSGSTIKIYAAGTPADGIYPTMQLILAGRVAKTFSDITGNPRTRLFNEYTYTVPAPVKITPDLVKVNFTNDLYKGSDNDRNLMIDKINIDGVNYQSESPVVYSTGAWTNGFHSCSPGNLQTEWLVCNGYFEYNH